MSRDDAPRDGSKGGPRTKAPTTIVRAEGTKLDAAQQAIVRELLDSAESVRSEGEALLRRFGRDVLTKALKGDSTEAIGVESSKNPIVRELLRRAGGPTLRLNSKTVSIAVRLAGYEQAINDELFRGLDLDRKALLFPLKNADAIREAAQHVVRFKLDVEATEAYVAGLRAKQGTPAVARLNPARATKHLAQFRKRFTDKRALPRLVASIEKLDDADRDALQKEVDAAAEVLAELKRALKKR